MQRLTYYIEPNRPEVASRIEQELKTLIADCGATLIRQTCQGSEVTLQVKVDDEFASLLRELFEEALDKYALAAPKQELQKRARELILQCANDPNYQYSPGVMKITEIAKHVAERLGHDDWVDDDQHWLWAMLAKELGD